MPATMRDDHPEPELGVELPTRAVLRSVGGWCGHVRLSPVPERAPPRRPSPVVYPLPGARMPRCRPPAASRSSSLSAAQARRMALAAQGFADPAAGREPDGWALRRVLDRVGADPDRLGQRARARALPAAVQPPRPLRHASCSTAPPTARRGGCSSTGATRRRCCRWPPSRCCAGGWSARATTPGAACGASSASGPSSSSAVLDEVRDRGPIAASEVADEHGGRRAPARGGTGRTSSGRSSGCSGAGRSPRRAGAASSASTTCPSACCRARSSTTPTPVARGRPARAGADRRARARRGGREATCATTSGCRSPRRARASPSSSRRGELWPVEVEGWTRAGLRAPGARGCRARSTPGRWSGRSTRWCGSARAWSGCSASATGSRSTSRSRSACTATTCCRSCSATGSSRASTSRPTAPPGVLRVQAVARRAGRAAGDGGRARRRARLDGGLARARRRGGAAAGRSRRPAGRRRVSV